MLKTLFLVLMTTALINNVVLSQFLGICPFLGVSKNVKTAAGMGGAVIFVITIASAVTNLLYTFVINKLHITYLNTIIFILVIAALVQLPLITTNCAVLGVALTNVQENNNFITSVITGFGTAVGFALAIIIMAGIRERIENNDFPKAFKGTPAVLLTACLMAIAFYGFGSLK